MLSGELRVLSEVTLYASYKLINVMVRTQDSVVEGAVHQSLSRCQNSVVNVPKLADSMHAYVKIRILFPFLLPGDVGCALAFP